MPNLLSDEEVFGAAPAGLLSDEQVFGKPAGPKEEPGRVSQTAATLLRQYGIGSGQLVSGVGQALQAPGATAKSLGYGALAAIDRGVNWLTRKAGGEGADDSVALQNARQAAAEAVDQRRSNIGSDSLIARLGLGLQAMGNDAQREHGAQLRQEAPEAVRQGDAIQKADGFVDTLKAMLSNPLGTAGTVAQSMPAMVAGAGISGVVGKAAGATARIAGAGEAAASRIALGAAENAGVAAEAGTSAMQNQQQVQDFVRSIPVEKLAQDSEQFRQIMMTPGMTPERARDVLAEQLGAQSALPAGLWTGAVNKATGAAAAIGKTAVTGRASARELVSGIAKEAVEEGLQNPGENLAQYGAQVEADPTQKFDLGGSVAQGLVSGAAMAAPLHGSGFVQQKVDDMRTARAAVPPAAPAVTETSAVVPQDSGSVTPDAAAAPAPSEAERALFEPRSLTSLDRVQEIDTELPRIESRLAELNRQDAGYGPAFDGERQELSGQAEALRQERNDLSKDWPKAVGGGDTSFTTEAGARVQARYALVDASELVTSHDQHLRPNPAYPQELQPRARDRAASEMQVSGIVQRLDPARLGQSADAANGAPIVGADGLVESGNARSIALKRIYRVPGEKAEAYKTWLRDNAESFGLHPSDVDVMQKPVLVRVRQTPVDRAEFARQANASTVAAMSPTEQAKSDAARIDSMEDLQPDEHGDFSGAGSRDFVRRFMARLPATEQAGMIDSSGRLSSAGYARVRNAVLARAYGDSPVLARMTESLDDNLRNISRALIASAPRVAQMRDAIAAGVRHDADLTPHVLGAVEELSRIKEEGRSVDDELAQAGLLGDKYSPETAEILRFLADNIRRPRRIADFIAATTQALDGAGDPRQTSMFGDAAAPAKADLISAAKRILDGEGPTTGDTQRAVTDQGKETGPGAGSEPAAAPGGAQRDQGAGAAGSGAGRVSGEEWARFPPEFESLNIPRADMPQLRGDARGALVNFLEARGIGHETGDVPAVQLKPAQLEYSPDKVRGWEKVRDNTDRSVLAAADGRILDGHHQWMDALARGADVKTIRFDAPFHELLDAARQFPSAEVSDDSAPKLSPEGAAKLDAMRAAAEVEKPAFDDALREIAKAAGGDVHLAKVKGVDRAAAKAVSDYGGDVTQLKDLLRGTIVVSTVEGASAAIAEIEKRFDVLAKGRRNNLRPEASPLDGYRDAKLNVRLPGGLLAEVQVNVPEMLAVKEKLHDLYKQRSALARKLEWSDEAIAKSPEIQALDAKMRAAYDAAWGEITDRAGSQPGDQTSATRLRNSASEISAPLRRADSEGNLRGAGGSQQAQYPGPTPAPMVTGMPSTSKNSQPSANLSGSNAASESGFMDTSEPILSAEQEKHLGAVSDFAAKTTEGWASPPKVIVVQSMSDPQVPAQVRELDAEQKSQGAAGEVEGFFHKGTIYLVAEALPDRAAAQRVLFHEALGHHGLRSVFGDRLKPILQQLAQARPDLVKPKARDYGLDFNDAGQRLQAAEEVLAELAQSRPELGFVQRTVSAIRNWLRANVPGFGKLRLSDADIIAGYILPARGWVERGGVAKADNLGPRFSRAPAPDSEAFKRWFGDSKVVDENGKPEVVYHGTSASQDGDAFTFFDTYASNYGLMGMGGYFTVDPSVASEYTSKGKGQTPTVYPVYLSIKAPLDMDAKADPAAWKAAFEGAEDYHEGGDTNESWYRAAEESLRDQRLPKWEGAEIMQEGIRGMGFDGVTHIGGGRVAADGVRHRVYIAFDPEQVKSVTGNRGTFDAGSTDIRFSRRTFDTSKTVAERADEIIANTVKARAPVDAAFRFVVNDVAKLPKIIDASIRAASAAIDRGLAMLPQSAQEAIAAGAERVRAGLVSDYGVPDAVIDQRALLQGRQRVQLRQAGKLVDALASLTRAESRVAYAWLNEADPHEAAKLMDDLPAESVKVLGQVAQMIDRLSQDAVALGQLSAEAFERHRFAYLRRSYAKHVLDQQTPEGKARRARAIAVLGEQYKGRGLVEAASMRQMQALAPEWWQRKLEAGKADTSLKGAQFVRLEKRAPSGEGTAPLEGMDGKAKGRLQEVAYYPAGEELPAKYADWDRGETFEVRDVQKDKLVLWRDFTKAEREQMGEIDEARFAIAKTLHGMIHDVEVGRYMEWLAHKYAIKNEAAVPGELVDPSESWHRAFKPGEWVQVPDAKIQGTDVAKYGKLAGRYLPGPVWNDLRQTVGGQFKPFGETFSKVLSAWKTAKTALSPAVHTNNIMSNFVMADWHDVSAAHTAKALRILLGAHDMGGAGGLNFAGDKLAAAGGIADREAAHAIVTRYKDSGGDIGSWATQEIAKDQLEPLLAAIEAEAKAGDPNSEDAQLAAASALELLKAGRVKDALKRAGAVGGKAVVTEAKAVIELYQSEDEVFRLAQWLKAKEGGATDLEAGKLARQSFMDYSINAPWVQAMRATAFPFIAYTYRAAPMLLETARRKPHKLMKLMALAAMANYLGVMIAGGGDDKERKLLPEEKAGGVWGLVPKLIRMPWNDAHGSPVYLDIRRFIPVGDVVDLGAGHSAVPLPPALQPGGPLAMLGEVAFNESAFTGKPITLETDTAGEKAAKLLDHVYKWATPNLLGLPNTYATQGVADAAKGRTDAFGREQSVAQALASTIGVKLGSYPADVMRRQLYGKLAAETIEIDKNIAQLKRQRNTNQITAEEFADKVRDQQAKKSKLQREVAEKVN